MYAMTGPCDNNSIIRHKLDCKELAANSLIPQTYFVASIHHIVGPSYRVVSQSAVYAATGKDVRMFSSHVRVCRHTAVTLLPATTSMTLAEGWVGFGGPLQARLLDDTSVWGCR